MSAPEPIKTRAESKLDDGYWMRQYALLAADYHHQVRQIRAADASKRQMAWNCHYRDRGACMADNEQKCEMQCGKAGVTIENGHIRRKQ